MMLPDINVLIYAYDKGSQQHVACLEWLESALNGERPVCFSWHTIMGFMRILTTVRMVQNSFTAKEAMDIADEILQAPVSQILTPGTGHFAIFRQLVRASGITGARLSDAHLAALAIEHGATVVSTNRDFKLFDGLKLIDPT